jgi:Fur family ferric uptake transcriptional regulator
MTQWSVEVALEAMRATGARVTGARRNVLHAVLDAGEHHFTAAEICAAVRPANPRPDRATVYRTLELLTELRVLSQLQLDGGATVYHRADQPHGHLVCQRCGRVEELPAKTVTAMASRIRRDHGFTLDPTGIALGGLCQPCQDDASP